MLKRTAKFWLFFWTLFIVSCAQDVKDIDKVQPDLVPKKFFTGEWYVKRTIVGAKHGSFFSFVGDQSNLERIRWRIEENQLIGVRTYEIVEGNDIYGQREDVNETVITSEGAKTFKYFPGAVVVYPIKSHVDIKRSYNAGTGEKTNVITENMSDRHWYDREYMRVDWGAVSTNDFDTISSLARKRKISAYTYRGENDDQLSKRNDKPVFAENFIDFVNYYSLATPNLKDLYGDEFPEAYWQYPACLLYVAMGINECYEEPMEVRTSMLKIDPKKVADYEDLVYDDQMMDKFGFFRAERANYNQERGMTWSGVTNRAMRFNFWQRSRDDNGAMIPYSNRQVKPIVYHLNDTFLMDKKLVEAAFQFFGEWNKAFVATVKGLGNAHQGPVLNLCFNNQTQMEKAAALGAVGPADYPIASTTYPEYCGDPNQIKNLGDLRYSILNLVDQPIDYGLLGYGPSAFDPLTGEIISATANIYGGAVDTYARYALDIIEYLAGTKTRFQQTSGSEIAKEVAANNKGFNRHEIDQIVKNLVSAKVSHHWEKKDLPKTDILYSQVRLRRILKADPGLEESISLPFNSLFRTPGLGVDYEFDQKMKKQASISNWGSIQGVHQMINDVSVTRELYKNAMERNMYLSDFADPAVIGLANDFKERYKNAADQKSKEAVTKEFIRLLRAEIFRAVAAHEVGHTLGLRHNFAASTDALNFQPDFWKLRGVNGKIGDPTTPAQAAGKIDQMKYSSIMDYQARFNADFHGIGRYDHAAIKFGYGQLVEVFQNPPNQQKLTQDAMIPNLSDTDHTDSIHHHNSQKLVDQFTRVHYTSIPSYWGGNLQAMQARKDVAWSKVKNDPKQVEVPYRFCSDDYNGVDPFCNTFDAGLDSYEIVGNYFTQYDEYYWLWGYKRDRSLYDYSSAAGRVARYLEPMLLQYQHWALNYHRYNRNNWWQRHNQKRWEEDPNGGKAQTLAVHKIMNNFSEVLTRPFEGCHIYDQTEKAFRNLGYNQEWCNEQQAKNAAAKYAWIGEEQGGRNLFDDYNYGPYMYWKEKQGSINGKLVAIIYFSDPTTYYHIMNPSRSADIRSFLINGFTMFPTEVMNLFSALALDDYKNSSWYWDTTQNRVVRPINFGWGATQQKAEVQSGKLAPFKTRGEYIFATTKFILPKLSLLYGTAYLTGTYDMDFTNNMRIWLKGHSEGVTPHFSQGEIVEYKDDLSGRIYQAAKSREPGMISLGYELVKKANLERAKMGSMQNMQLNYNLSELQYIVGKMDLIRKYMTFVDNI